MTQCGTGTLKGAGRRDARKARQRSRCAGLRRCGAILAASVLSLTSAGVRGRPLEAATNAASNSPFDTPLEYEVKAAFLFRFAEFVEWPADTFKGTSEPFTYCTIGDDPFRGALERTLSGKN
jgi:YfiR/HmsC-like